MRHRGSSASIWRSMVSVAAVVALAAGCSSGGEPESPPLSASSPSPTGPASITFAVYGPDALTQAYTKIAQRFTAQHPDVTVQMKRYPDRLAAMEAYQTSLAAGTPPDLFLMDHDDLSSLEEANAVHRVDELLGERRVDFGDGYGRNGLEAFSADSALQCMPADASPLVVYYNPRLIDLSTVAEPGRNPVDQDRGWSLDEFAAAARQPRAPGVRGVYVVPSIDQVAPFVWSGGGEIVDDLDRPTTLRFSDGASAAAMERLLEVVRDPGLTFSQKALARRSALDRFKAGQLGMLIGYRDLTPVLRAQPDLLFDVMPMPRLSARATSAHFQGLCISEGSKRQDDAADLLTEVVSDRSAAQLAETGYAMPTNLDVLNSETFQQGTEQPLHGEVFVRELRAARPLPDTTTWPAVQSQAAGDLTALFYDPVIDPVIDRLTAIDEASMPIFDPKMATDPSSTATPSVTPESPSASPTP